VPVAPGVTATVSVDEFMKFNLDEFNVDPLFAETLTVFAASAIAVAMLTPRTRRVSVT
jgi:hypothetical protein